MFLMKDDFKLGKMLETERLEYADIDIPGLIAVHEHWSRVKGDNVAPSLRDFRLQDLPPKIVPFMALIDFVGPPFDFRYRFFGSKMVEGSGFELTGKTYYADKVEGYGFVNAKLLPVMIAKRHPLYTRTTWKSVKGLLFKTTSIRMPLSNDGTEITGAATVNDFAWA